MGIDLKTLIEDAQKPTPWDFGNGILYDICNKNPLHCDKSIVIAKIWLIGRAYAAAIERGPTREDSNDDFYVQTVAPTIIESKIDHWITDAKDLSLSCENIDSIVKCHGSITELFKNISGMDKRSLASKYLHFHVPGVFFIYDTRAVSGLRKLSKFVKRAKKYSGNGDNEYRKFAEKCLSLRDHIKTEYKVEMSPRQIDQLLLNLAVSVNDK